MRAGRRKLLRGLEMGQRYVLSAAAGGQRAGYTVAPPTPGAAIGRQQRPPTSTYRQQQPNLSNQTPQRSEHRLHTGAVHGAPRPTQQLQGGIHRAHPAGGVRDRRYDNVKQRQHQGELERLRKYGSGLRDMPVPASPAPAIAAAAANRSAARIKAAIPEPTGGLRDVLQTSSHPTGSVQSAAVTEPAAQVSQQHAQAQHQQLVQSPGQQPDSKPGAQAPPGAQQRAPGNEVAAKEAQSRPGVYWNGAVALPVQPPLPPRIPPQPCSPPSNGSFQNGSTPVQQRQLPSVQMSAAVADPALDDPQTQFRDSDRWEDAALAEPAVPAGQPQDIPAATVPDSDRTGARGSSGRPPMGLAKAESEADEDTEPAERAQMTKLHENVHVVGSAAEARRVADMLVDLAHRNPNLVFGADTEVSYIDVTKESPCAKGTVICFSLYCGEDSRGEQLDFTPGGHIPGTPCRNMLWVDTLLNDEDEEAAIFEAFKPFFEDPSIMKVWHNYSFDRHVMKRMGINCQGFLADTMHMARLWDSSRTMGKGYSLEALTADKHLMSGKESGAKVSMKKLFSKQNVKKDGTLGKLSTLPPMDEIQMDPESRFRWIFYSALDAKATWELFGALRDALESMECVEESIQTHDPVGYSMWDMYRRYWQPFGELLTDMERAGMQVNRDHLAEAEKLAKRDQETARQRFQDWATSKVEGARHMNPGSGAQIRQLLFAGTLNAKQAVDKKGKKTGPQNRLEFSRVFKMPNTEGFIEEGKKKPKKTRDIELWGLWGKDVESPLKPEVYTGAGWPAVSTPVLRQLAGKPGAALQALGVMEEAQLAADMEGSEGGGEAPGSSAEEWSVDDAVLEDDENAPVATLDQLQKEAAEGGFGTLYAVFGGGKEGLEACAAVDSLCNSNAIDTLLSNFIVPLQGDEISTTEDGKARVHCSLNINTETGRLSARRPNLQNQPALEKDRYKVRQAFTADVSKGHTLIVADYGQLELRLLAHMASCESMLQAFRLGGDFHSRTALGMYDNIKQAIAEGKCLLEWDGEGKPPVPLLKNMFANERRKAKVLNFSIAYGKTAHGLSKDFRTSVDEAKETVDKWYADRHEVRTWQEEHRKQAINQGYVCTMLGRRRKLPGAQDKDNRPRQGHALRAAINTPIQGSAADVAAAAMVSIQRNEQLRTLGWKLLLQVHDEVILEGPRESAEEAQAIVVDCMERPFDGTNPLQVHLVVDAKFADTWYEAK